MRPALELTHWLSARLEDLVVRLQEAAPAATLNVETRSEGGRRVARASGLATPDAEPLELTFELEADDEPLRVRASLTHGGATLDALDVGDAEGESLRARLLAFVMNAAERMATSLHAEARGSEHEAELVERMRGQAARARERGEHDEALQLYRMLTMMVCEEADLAAMLEVERSARAAHLARLRERFPQQRALLDRIAG